MNWLGVKLDLIVTIKALTGVALAPTTAMSSRARIENTFAFIGNLFLEIKLM